MRRAITGNTGTMNVSANRVTEPSAMSSTRLAMLFQPELDVVPGAPAALQVGANGPSREVEPGDIEQDEEAEDGLAVLPLRRHVGLIAVVDAYVECQAEDDRGADENTEEDAEELVDA